MANWSRTGRGKRVRYTVTTPSGLGLARAWEYTFVGTPPVPVDVTLDVPALDFFSASPGSGVYSTFVAQGPEGSIDSFAVSAGSSVVVDTNITQPAGFDFHASSPNSSVRYAFDEVGETVSYLGNTPERQYGRGPVIATAFSVPSGSSAIVRANTVTPGATPPVIAPLPFTFPPMVEAASLTVTVVPVGASLVLPLTLVYTGARYDSSFYIHYLKESPDGNLREYTLNMAWSLGEGAEQQLQERVVSLYYDLLAVELHTRSLGIQYALDVASVEEREFNIAYAQGLSEIEFNFTWSLVGTTFWTELLGHVNQARIQLGRAKLLRLYDGSGPDIAHIHSEHMRYARVYEHDADAFPVGWQMFEDRVDRLTHAHGACLENLGLVAAGWDGAAFAFPDAYEVFTLWMNSPYHYANMMYDWGPDSDPTMSIGVEYGGRTPTYYANGNPVFPALPDRAITYLTQVFIDMVSNVGEELMQRDINFAWSQTGAMIETYNMGWSQDAFKHVAARFETGYSIKLAAQFQAHWGVRVAAQFEAPQHYTTSFRFAAPYGSMVRVRQQFGASYDLRPLNQITVAFEAPYGTRVAAQFQASYDHKDRVRTQFSATYGDKPMVSLSFAAPYGVLGRVGVSFAAPYAIRRRVSTGIEAPYGDLVSVKYQFSGLYDLLERNRVQALFIAPYALHPDVTSEITRTQSIVTVTHNGKALAHDDIEVSSSEDEFLWTGRVSLVDATEYMQIAVNDPIQLTLGSTTFNMIVTNKSITRDDPVDVTMDLTCHSPTIRHSSPRATTLSYMVSSPTYARTIAETVVGEVIDWQIVDWLVPAAYFAVEDVEPISVVQQIAEAAGGLVETTPAGTLRVRYKFPTSVPDMATHKDVTLYDAADMLSCGETVDYSDLYNRFRIRGNDGTVSDELEFIKDEESADTGVINGYIMPWRETVLTHTGGATVSLGTWDIATREEEEVLEITSGSATLKYPAIGLTSVVWKSDPLGTLALDPRTRTVTATDLTNNYGYGLVEVKYVVEYYTCTVQFPVGNTAQFILTNKE